jgi:DNA polymerase-3 subunit delta'
MAWDDILGHELAKRMLQGSLDERQAFGAILLAGPDGIGKRRLALEAAKALNCSGEGDRPCDVCACCGQINRGTHPDLHLLVPKGASAQIPIDDVRALIGRIGLRPFNARVQVAIIDGAERLTEEAANSLLKSLEEPPGKMRFFLVSTRPQDCLPTITSRCQLIRCEGLAPTVVEQIVLRVQGCDPALAGLVAKRCGGSVSRAIDLAVRWSDYEAVLSRLAQERPLAWVEHPLPETRQDVTRLLEGMVGWLRDLAVVAVKAPPGRVVHAEHADALSRQAKGLDVDRCVETAFELVSLRESLEQFVSPRLVATLAREKWLSLMQD